MEADLAPAPVAELLGQPVPVEGVVTDVIHPRLVVLHPQPIQPLEEHLSSQPGPLQGVATAIADLAVGDEGVPVAHIDLQLFRQAAADCTPSRHPVFSILGEAYPGKVRYAVWGQVGRRVVDLIEHLLLAGVHAHQPPGALHLGEGEAAGLVKLHQGEAQVVQIRHLFIAGVGIVASGDLTAALQQMPGQHALAQLLRIVQRPAVLVAQGGQGEGGVGHPAGDHHVCTVFQRFDDALRPHIGVGGDNTVRPLAHFALKLQDGLAPVLGQRLIDAVPGDGGKFQPGEALLPGDFHGFGHCGLGVDRPHVGNYFDTMLLGGLKHLGQAVLQQAAVALGGVFQHFLPGQPNGALGQALEDDVVQVPLLDQGDGRVNAVTGKAGAASNADFFHNIQSHNLSAGPAVTGSAQKR